MKRKADSDDELLPTVPGCEFSGEVLEAGDTVSNIAVGEKIVSILRNDYTISYPVHSVWNMDC